MDTDTILREKLATCTRIVAMQGLIGVFGHVSVFDPDRRRVFLSPGMGSDRSTTRAQDIFVLDRSGKILEPGEGDVPVEWPIHTALHAAHSNAVAVAHLHSPYATLFTIADRPFQPVTLQGALFAEGVPLYREANLVKTPAQGRELVEVMNGRRAVLMRGHGAVLAAPAWRKCFSALLCSKTTRVRPCRRPPWETSELSVLKNVALSTLRLAYSAGRPESGNIWRISKHVGIAKCRVVKFRCFHRPWRDWQVLQS